MKKLLMTAAIACTLATPAHATGLIEAALAPLLDLSKISIEEASVAHDECNFYAHDYKLRAVYGDAPFLGGRPLIIGFACYGGDDREDPHGSWGDIE